MRVRKSGTSAKYFSSIPPQDGDQPSFAFRYGSPLFVLAALTFYGCAAGFNNDEVLQDSLSITDGASHDFGNSTVGKSADKTLTVQNKSRFDIYLLDLTPEKAKFSDDFKVTGGTCTQTSVLTMGSDCSLSLSFNPKSKGEVTGVLPIGFQDDFNSATLALTLRGYAKNPGILTLSELGSYDFGERGLLSESTHVFTLSNSGEAPITFRTLSTESLSLSAPFKRATSGATCATGSTLAVSNTCLLPIVFAPSQSGEVRQVLNIPYYNDSSTTALSLAIRGTGGSVSLLSLSENSPFNFGDVPIGSSSTHVFTLTQLEGVGAVLGDATSSTLLSLTAPFSFLGGSCSNGLRLIASPALTESSDTSSLSSSCTLSVAFTPTQANLETQTLQLNYYDGISNSTYSRDLRGMGVSPPSLVAVPAGTYDYGTRTVGTTTSKSFQLVNQGQASTTLGTITGASIGSSSPFSLSGGTCTTGSTLGPLTGSCTLIIDYVPTTAILSTQSLSISYLTGTSATTSSLVSFGVKGTGQFLAELTISDASHYSYGNNSVGSVSTRVFTLTNSSAVAAVLGNVATSGNVNLSAPYSRSGGTCANSQTLSAGGGSCTVEISYSPTVGGVSTTQLSISYHNGTSQTYLLQGLGGVGVGRAAIAISPSGYDHGSKVISTVSTSVFTLSNTGGSTATFGSLADAGLGLSSPFSKTGGSCSSSGTLTSGSSCTLTLAFTPVAATSSTSVFTIVFSDQGGTLSSTASISGTGINGAALTYSDSPSFDFGSVTVDLTSVRTFTITNSGTNNGTLGTISTNDLGLSAPFSLTGGSCASGATITLGGGTCTLEVTASPTSAGLSSTQISLAYQNGGGMISALLPLAIQGLSHSVLSLTPLATFDFGNVPIGGSSNQTFTVTNQGQTSATLGTINTANLNLSAPFSHTGGTCSSSGTVAPSATCTLTIQYSPVAQTGSQTTLSLNYTDLGGTARPSTTHALQGTGVTPATLAITPSGSFNFGSQTVGLTTTQAFTITNSGSTSATLGTIDTAGLGLAAPFTLSSGTCASSGTVAAASSCVITLSFAPSSAVNSNVSLSVAYNDGVTSQSTTKDLGGLGITPATLTISDGPTFDYGSQVVTTAHSKVFTINNTGATAAALGTINSSNLNLSAPFSFNSTTCGASITAGGNCTITADFTPSAATTSTALLSLAYSDGVTSSYSSRDLKGTGLSRATLVSAPASPFNFGNVTIGNTSTQVFTLTNSGEATATLSAVSQGAFALAGTDYAFTGGECSTGGSVAGSAACTLTLTYAPSTAGASTRTLTLDYSDAAGTRPALSHSLQGTGISVASLTLTPSDAFDFGSKSIGSTSTQIFTLTNSGATAATLGTIDTAGLGLAAPFSHNAGSSTCSSSGSVSATGGTCIIAIDYAPAAAVTSNATLSVSFNNGASMQSTLKPIQGTGISAASLAITPSGSFNFGSQTVGLTTTQAFTITNSGSTSATLGTIDTAGLGLAAPFTLSSGTCASSGTVAAASSCVVTLSFTPSSAVNSNVTLSVAYNDGVTSQSTTKDLGGLGITPATLAITPSGSFNFGSVTVGNTSTQAFTITNSGSTSATLGTIDTAGLGLAAPFTLSSGTCASSGTVAAASSCVVTLSFAPSAAVNSNVTLSVAYNDGVAAQSTTKDLGGLGITPATLAVTPSGSFDFGSVTVGNTSTQAFTITNSGSTSATLGTIDTAGLGLAAPFTLSSGTCASSGAVAAASSCVITLSFAPSAAVNSNVSLSVAYNDGVNSQSTTKDLGGLGITPATLTISDGPTYDYGSKVLTTATSKIFTINNTGATAAALGTLNSANLNLSAPFSYNSTTCGASITAGGNCTITADFTPSAATTSSAILSLAYNNGVSSTSSTRDLNGTGISQAALALTPSGSFNFGSKTLTTTTTQTFTLTNSGQATATLGTISTAGLNLGAPFTHSGGNCSSAGTLAASASCTIAVDYTPTNATNSNAVLSVAYSDEASSKSTTKDLGGMGLSRALLAITPGPTVGFGSKTVTTTTSLALTITNSGASTATLGTISTAGLGLTGSDFGFQSGTCASSGTLSPESTCVITTSFTPGSSGAKSKTLALDYSDAGGSLSAANSALEGTGLTAATLAITPAGVHDFGEVGIGNTSSQTFTVSNTGQTDATLTDISNAGLLLSSTPFSLASSTCSTSATLTGGSGDCTVTVEFAPTSAISSTVTFSISYDNGLAQTTAGATVQGTGINLGTPALTLSPLAYHFGSVLAGDNSSIKTFTFTNSGDGVASGCSAPTITGGDGKLVITQDGCGTASLAASSSCTVSLQVQGPVLGSTYSATLTRACTDTSINTIENGLRFKGTHSIAVRDIATGYYHTCATLMDGSMKCWGYNSEGQLGYGDSTPRGGSGGSMASLNTLNLGSGVRAVEIAAGYYHTCAILDTGDTKCWGRNAQGQLGQDHASSYGASNSETPSALSAINIGTDRKTRSIAAGQTNTCAIRDDGELKCWGDYPALGFTGDNTPKGDASGEMSSLAVVTLDDNGTIHKALNVGIGKDNGCAATDRGKLFCWGSNANGEAGQDTSSANFTPSILPNVGYYTRATKVKVNENFACAIDEVTGLSCWGSCAGYELGNGCPTNATVGVNSGDMATLYGPMYVSVKDLRLGYQTGCGLSYNGKLSCWGSSHHVLGNGVAAAAESATEVSLGSHRVRNFDLYREHACAVFGDGGLRCWGKDQFGDGMLGRDNGLSYGANSTTELATMTPVNLGVKIGPIDVGMNTYHTCAVLNDGSLKCWGYGLYGGLGLGDGVTRGTQPWDMETLPEVNLGTGNYAASVSHGLQHTCVTLVTGEVKCFGAGGNGRLGQNHDDSLGVTSANEVATLTAVNTSGTFLRNLQVGDYHNCGVTDYGNAYCWGYNAQGQLGLNDTTDRGTALDPMAWWMVNDGSGSVYTSIAAGYIHTCGATIGGQVFCWGSGASGETGQDSTTNFGSGTGGLEVSSGLGALPVTGVTKIVAGGHHSCALDSSGQVKCWGDNSYGQLGNGSWNTMGDGTGDSISAVTAVNLGAGLRAIDIAAGTWHTCAILGDRSVKCWGYNSDGQLGYNDTTTRGTPSVPVSGLSAVNFGAGKKALKIFAGSSSNGTCVITTDGELKCWGLNDVGQLGQGSTLNWGSGASGSSLSDMPAVPLR